MKRALRILLMAAALTTVLCISAFAAEDFKITAGGFYGIDQSDSEVKITPQASAASGLTLNHCSANVKAESGDIVYEDFYANSDKMSVEVSGLTAGEQYLVMLVTGDGTSITQNTIKYINQDTPTNGKITFDVYPMLDSVDGRMTLVVTGTNNYTRKNIALNYAPSATYDKQPYKLGDINADGSVDAIDALLALQIAAENITYTDIMKLAANADGVEGIDALDALAILILAAS